MLSNTLRLNFFYLKSIQFFHPRYYPKIGYNLKTSKRVIVCIHDILQLIMMKMKMKMKNRSCRYNINRSRSRHGHKYIKYKNSA